MTLTDLFDQAGLPLPKDIAARINSGDLEDFISFPNGSSVPMVNYRAPNQHAHQLKRFSSLLLVLTPYDERKNRGITELASAYLLGQTLTFIPDTDPDAWVDAYADARMVETCMSARSGELVPYDTSTPESIRRMPLRTRAVKAYAAGQYLTSTPEPFRSQKLALAVLRNRDGVVLARAVVNVRDKKFATAYGSSDSSVLYDLLRAYDYERTDDAFHNCLLRTTKITTFRNGERVAPTPDNPDNPTGSTNKRDTYWLCPYLDGLRDLQAVTFGDQTFFKIVGTSDDRDVSVDTFTGKICYNGEFRHARPITRSTGTLGLYGGYRTTATGMT